MELDCSIAWIPYIREEATLATAVEAATGDYLFFHWDVLDALWGPTTRSATGVPVEYLKKFRMCVGGHIHKPQAIGNVHYVGSPFSCDWGEVNQAKRLLLLDTKTNKLTSLPLSIRNYLDPTLPDFPKRKLTRRDTVRVTAPYGEHGNLPEVVRKARSRAAKYKPAAIHVVPVKEAEEKLPLQLDPTVGDEELLQEYLEAQQAENIDQLSAYVQYHLAARIGIGQKPVEFRKVRAQEALSYEGMTMEYRPGLSLLTGRSTDWENRSNGTGKSNCLAMPTIALSGANPKGQEHDGWRREGAQAASYVSLDLSIGKQKLRVTRGRSPVRLKAEVEGKNTLSGDSRQAQRDLERLTGLTRDVLMNSLYIDQREVNILLSGTEKQRKTILAQFLGLDRFERALQAIRQNILQTQKAIVEAQDEVVHITGLLDVHNRSLEQASAGQHTSVEALTQEKKEVEGRLHACQARLRWLTAGPEESWLDVLGTLQNSLTGEQNSITHEEDLLRRELERLESLPDTCPTCRQPVERGTLEGHQKEIQQQIDSLRDSCTSLSLVVGRVTAWWNGLEARRALRSDTVSREKTTEDDLTHDLARISYKLDALTKLNAVQKEHQQQIQQLTARRRVHQQYKKQLLELLEFQKEAAASVSRTGLPAFLIANACPKLNDAATFYSDLFTGSEIQVEFAITEDRTLDVHIVNVHGAQDLRGQSEGETRMASLITSFSVRDVLAQTNLLILDEPGDGLDDTNAQAFAEALPSVVDRFGCVIVTTHNPYIISGLEPDYRYLVTKTDGVSRLEEVR
jgi:hypothetical protein